MECVNLVVKPKASPVGVSPRWVGYNEEDLEGQQYILEEGEYPHFSDWGGCEGGLLSLRPIITVRRRPRETEPMQ